MIVRCHDSERTRYKKKIKPGNGGACALSGRRREALGQKKHREHYELLGLAGTVGKEVQAGERDQVDSQLAQIRIQLTGETQGAGDTGHDGRDEVVQVAEGGGGQLQGAEANIVQGLVILQEAKGTQSNISFWKLRPGAQ
eukprot:1144545-Pelagomonas_calceolata.AAC.4